MGTLGRSRSRVGGMESCRLGWERVARSRRWDRDGHSLSGSRSLSLGRAAPWKRELRQPLVGAGGGALCPLPFWPQPLPALPRICISEGSSGRRNVAIVRHAAWRKALRLLYRVWAGWEKAPRGDGGFPLLSACRVRMGAVGETLLASFKFAARGKSSSGKKRVGPTVCFLVVSATWCLFLTVKGSPGMC